MERKICCTCGEEKDISGFTYDEITLVILDSCIECEKIRKHKEYKRQWYLDNKERRKEKDSENGKLYYKNNKEKVRNRQKLYELENKQKKKEYSDSKREYFSLKKKEYRKNNWEKVREQEKENQIKKRNQDQETQRKYSRWECFHVFGERDRVLNSITRNIFLTTRPIL